MKKRAKIRRIRRRATVLLLLAVFLLIHVKGQAGEKAASLSEYEEQYLTQVRSLLEEEGYSDCGLMLNYVRESDGWRNYTLTVHHERIARLEEGQKGELLAALTAIPFDMDNCTVSGKFLEIQ